MLYLHVGLHKTGTTYLQSAVFPHWQGIRYLRHLTVENFLRVAPDDTALASREGFSGPAIGDQEEKRAFLKRLSEMFPQARILLGFRKHASYINALYSQYLRYGGQRSLTGFFDLDSKDSVLTTDDIQFRTYVEAAKEYWGREPFVFLLPELAQDPERLRRDLGRFVGREPPIFPPPAHASRNASLGKREAEILRRINILTGTHLHRDSSTRPYRMLRCLSLDPPSLCQRWAALTRSTPIMDRASAERIDQHYTEDWQALVAHAQCRPALASE